MVPNSPKKYRRADVKRKERCWWAGSQTVRISTEAPKKSEKNGAPGRTLVTLFLAPRGKKDATGSVHGSFNKTAGRLAPPDSSFWGDQNFFKKINIFKNLCSPNEDSPWVHGASSSWTDGTTPSGPYTNRVTKPNEHRGPGSVGLIGSSFLGPRNSSFGEHKIKNLKH